MINATLLYLLFQHMYGGSRRGLAERCMVNVADVADVADVVDVPDVADMADVADAADDASGWDRITAAA